MLRYGSGMRQVLEPFLPPLVTPTARSRVLMGDFCLVVGSTFPSIALLHVLLAP